MALDTNLVAYWKMDESSGDATDSVASHTLTNTNVTYGTGKINNGAAFNSTGDSLRTTTDTDFFFQAEDGIRDLTVTGVQTCALPIFNKKRPLVYKLEEGKYIIDLA